MPRRSDWWGRLPAAITDPANFFRWDRLRGFGNSGAVKLTPAIPIVGYLILFNASLEHYLELVFDRGGVSGAWRLYAMYFGFTAIGAGSLLYQLFCPAEIKQHGAAWEFVNKEGPALNRHRKDEYREILVQRRYGELLAQLPGQYAGNWTLARNHFTGGLNPEPPDRQEMQRIGRSFIPMLESDLGRWRDSDTELLTDYFVPLKDLNRRLRGAVGYLYFVGFAILSLPTIDVFYRVTRQAIITILRLFA